MPQLDRFLIAPYNTGTQTDLKPWLIPGDAFQELRNAYIFRGRVTKRFGSFLIPPNTAVASSLAPLASRLRVQVDTVTGGASTQNLTALLPGMSFDIGQLFSVGTQIFTVFAASGNMLKTGTATIYTFDTATGIYNLTGLPDANGTPVYFYPALPVMGLLTYEQGAINEELTYAFDTRFAYRYAAEGWTRLGTGATATWSGDDTEFFWGRNYRGATADATLLFVTNFKAADKMRYWDGSAWFSFNPRYLGAADLIQTARIIIPFKNRLLLLNTVENVAAADKSFVNRCRFSQSGSPIAADAFRTDIAGKGGFVDIPTKEAIISARLLKDRLIVFCERSTWELVFTGNNILPFVFQQINSELGVESPFSTVPFDKVAIGVGNVGIHACNGLNVERVDQKIPDEVYNIHNDNDGVLRVYGIRDYYTELVYWTFPSDSKEDKFPRRVLIYNYNNGSWAMNDDSITCFGYFQSTKDLRWEDIDYTWAEWTAQWNSATFQSEFPAIIAGNQEGFTFIASPKDTYRNAPALQITNLVIAAGVATITVINHNLVASADDSDGDGDFVLIENASGITWRDEDGVVIDSIIKPILTTTGTDTFTINVNTSSGTYAGGGTIARVSRIDIKTKQYNFYNKQGENLFIPIIDFLVDKAEGGQVTVDYLPSSSERDFRQDGIDSGAILGTGVLETSPYDDMPLEAEQSRFWHPVYPQIEGECIQFRIYLSDAQMEINLASLGSFELNAMMFYAQRVHRK